MRQHAQKIFGVLLCVVFLSACSFSPKEDARHAQAERACIEQCGIAKDNCYMRCTDSCTLCDEAADKRMRKNYKKYIHEQCVQGKRIALQLQSFRDPLKCRKVSCDCPADYRVCVSTCRGKIRKYFQVMPFCC